MNVENLRIELSAVDLRILCECAHTQTEFWKKGLERCAEGSASPVDFNDCQEEADLEFYVERHEQILKQLDDTLGEVQSNELDYLDEFQMFRTSQRVESIRLLGPKITKLIFVFHTRHGSHFLYEQLEDLVMHFVDDSEPKYRFESEAELECFLKCWKI